MSQEAQKPELTINDLAAMKNLIEVVTNRGAFKANELSAVGSLFDKLNLFLQAAQPPAPQEQEQQSQEGEQNG